MVFFLLGEKKKIKPCYLLFCSTLAIKTDTRNEITFQSLLMGRF